MSNEGLKVITTEDGESPLVIRPEPVSMSDLYSETRPIFTEAELRIMSQPDPLLVGLPRRTSIPSIDELLGS